MNPYRRAALFFLRLSGVGCVVIGIAMLGGDVLTGLSKQTAKTNWFTVLLEAGLVAGGVLLLWRSGSIAARWTDDFAEPEEKSVEELLESEDDEP